MKVPSRIKVGHLDYTIKEEADPMIGEQKVDGHISYAASAIRLRKDISASYKREVLLHELTHAIADQRIDDKDHKEYVVKNLSQGILLLLRDNKELVRYLVS